MSRFLSRGDALPLCRAMSSLTSPVVGILQPSYIPWLGAFDMLAACDIWIFYDDVQYNRRSFRNRNRIKTIRGAEYLTVPVEKQPRDTPTNAIRIAEVSPWAEHHLSKLRESYSSCPGFSRVQGVLADAFERRGALLVDLNTDLMRTFADLLGLQPSFLNASDLGASGRGQERILELCRSVGATTYVNGAAGRDLYDPDTFRDAGIELVFHEYEHPRYEQPHGEFIDHLSIVDLLMTYEPSHALEILRRGSNLPTELKALQAR